MLEILKVRIDSIIEEELEGSDEEDSIDDDDELGYYDSDEEECSSEAKTY